MHMAAPPANDVPNVHHAMPSGRQQLQVPAAKRAKVQDRVALHEVRTSNGLSAVPQGSAVQHDLAGVQE